MSKEVPEIRYTNHLERRLRIRDIPERWPREIVQGANIYYYDNETDNLIAIEQRSYEGRVRDFLVAFNEADEGIEIIIIHPRKGDRRKTESSTEGGLNMKESDSEKVYYDSQADVLYIISEKGKEEEFVEISPGVYIELNRDGKVIGIEVLRASKLLSSVLEPLREKSLQK